MVEKVVPKVIVKLEPVPEKNPKLNFAAYMDAMNTAEPPTPEPSAQ